MRTYDPKLIGPAIKLFLGSDTNVDPAEWIANPENIALVNDRGDLTLFEKGIKHIYTGHYYFKSKGRQAIDNGQQFLDELFNSCYNINVVMGMCPLKHLGARWMSRKLGFTSHGVVHLNDKHYELFILTKKEFNNE